MKETGLLWIAIMALVICSCGSRSERVSYIPEKLVGDDAGWGFVDSHGKIVCDDQLKGLPTPVINGFFRLDSNGKASVYRLESGKPELLGDLKNLRAAGFMAEGLIPVFREDGRLDGVDGFGVTRFSTRFIGGHRILLCSPIFRCGLLGVCYSEEGEKLWGAIDREGRAAIAPAFVNEPVFNEDVALVMFPVPGGHEDQIIDTRGNLLYRAPDELSIVSMVMHDGRFVYCQRNRWGLLSKNGERYPLPAWVNFVVDFNDTYIIYGDEKGRNGLMNRDGRKVLRPRYSHLWFGAKGQLLAQDDSDIFSLIDYSGNLIARFDDASWVTYIGSRPGLKSDFAYAVTYADRTMQLYDASGMAVGNDRFCSLMLPEVVFGLDALYGGDFPKQVETVMTGSGMPIIDLTPDESDETFQNEQ